MTESKIDFDQNDHDHFDHITRLLSPGVGPKTKFWANP